MLITDCVNVEIQKRVCRVKEDDKFVMRKFKVESCALYMKTSRADVLWNRLAYIIDNFCVHILPTSSHPFVAATA